MAKGPAGTGCRRAVQRGRDRFTRFGPSPNMDRLVALKNHMAAKELGQPHFGLTKESRGGKKKEKKGRLKHVSAIHRVRNRGNQSHYTPSAGSISLKTLLPCGFVDLREELGGDFAVMAALGRERKPEIDDGLQRVTVERAAIHTV